MIDLNWLRDIAHAAPWWMLASAVAVVGVSSRMGEGMGGSGVGSDTVSDRGPTGRGDVGGGRVSRGPAGRGDVGGGRRMRCSPSRAWG
jgi:hypothetical protein